jgi:ferredoxin
VEIAWQGVSFTGNNQQILLEQLEQQGIRIPYSCRAGFAAAAASGWKKEKSAR